MKKLTLLIISIFALNCAAQNQPVVEKQLGSENLGSESGSKEEGTGITSIQANFGVVKDSSGATLGHAVSAHPNYIQILSENGFLYEIDWEGTIRQESIYYTTSDCSGVPYAYGQNGFYRTYGKSVYKRFDNSSLYKPKSVDGNNIAIETIVTLEAAVGWGDTSCDPLSTSQPNKFMIELVPTSKSEIGMPDPLTLPLYIEQSN